LNGRRDLLRLLSGERGKPFPVIIPYVGILLRDHLRQICNLPWWKLQYGTIEERVGIYERMLEKIDIDWVPARLCPPASSPRSRHVSVRGGRTFLQNLETGEGRRKARAVRFLAG